MNSRVERYNHEIEESELPSRVEKNKDFYSSVDMSQISRIKLNENERVLTSSSKIIDLEKIKKYIDANNEEVPIRRSIVESPEPFESKDNSLFEEKRDYDINSVLEKAKEKKENYYESEKYKKLRDTQYDILNKIQIADEAPNAKEDIELNTDEKTLIDLINTVTINKRQDDLLSELKGDENTLVTSPIKEETKDEFIEKSITKSIIEQEKEETSKTPLEENTIIKNLDKSFYTNSMTFSKEDFEGFEELEKSVKKSNNLVKIVISFLILIALVTLFVVFKFVLNIF